jgi:hypothetical protein
MRTVTRTGEQPIAIVGSGPSVRDFSMRSKLRREVWAINGAYNFLQDKES